MHQHPRQQIALHPWLAAVCLAASTALADDWPQWRGPRRDGKSAETGLLKAWPAGGPPLAWKATGLGAGFATVAVAKGVIYTAGYQEHGRFEQLDQSGKEAWTHPVIANGRLYVRDQDVLLCYDVRAK